jgi:hypothetical protein
MVTIATPRSDSDSAAAGTPTHLLTFELEASLKKGTQRPRSAVLQISADGVQDNFNAIYINPPGVLGSDPNLGPKR